MAIEKELLVISICQLDDVVPIYTLDDVESVFFYDSTGCKAEREATQLPALSASYTHSTQYIYKLCISHSGHTISHLRSCNSHWTYSSILLDCAGVQSFIYFVVYYLFVFIYYGGKNNRILLINLENISRFSKITNTSI